MRIVAIDLQFAKVGCAPFWCAGPQHVRQVFPSEALCWNELVESRLDRDHAFLTFNTRFTLCVGRKGSAFEVDVSGSAARSIVDGFRGSTDDGHTEDRHIILTACRRL